jgi:hypothetical protein
MYCITLYVEIFLHLGKCGKQDKDLKLFYYKSVTKMSKNYEKISVVPEFFSLNSNPFFGNKNVSFHVRADLN